MSIARSQSDVATVLFFIYIVCKLKAKNNEQYKIKQNIYVFTI